MCLHAAGELQLLLRLVRATRQEEKQQQQQQQQQQQERQQHPAEQGQRETGEGAIRRRAERPPDTVDAQVRTNNLRGIVCLYIIIT